MSLNKIIIPGVVYCLGGVCSDDSDEWERGSLVVDPSCLKLVSNGLDVVRVGSKQLVEAQLVKEGSLGLSVLVVDYLEDGEGGGELLIAAQDDIVDALLSLAGGSVVE